MGAGSSMEGPRTLWDIRWRWIATTAWALAACAGPPTAPAVPTHEGFVFGYVQDLTGHPVIGIRVRVRTGCRPSAAACGMPAPRVVEGDTVTEALGYYGFHYEIAMPDPVPDSATVAPSACSAVAIACPRPPEAPVTNAFFPFKSNITLSF